MSGPTEPDHSTLARSFDATAGAYELGRPGYPAAALEFWRARGAFADGSDVLDLAAGTGKLTRLVPPTCRRVAVEPLAQMREQFNDAVPDVTILDGTAEAIPLPDDSVDTVLVAQAFHWFDHQPALREIARVLRRGGGLGLIWNEDDPEPAPWLAEIVDAKRLVAASTVVSEHPVVEVLAAAPDFGPTETFECRWASHTTVDRVLADVASRSYVSALPPEERDAVTSRARRSIERALGTDVEAVEYPYRTTAFWSTVNPH